MKAEPGSDKSSHVRKVVLEVLKGFNKKGITISDSTSFVSDLEFDSLLVMEFISELEDQLDVSVPINILPDIETVGMLIVNAERIVREEHG